MLFNTQDTHGLYDLERISIIYLHKISFIFLIFMKCLKESAVIMIFDDSFIQSEVSIFIRELISMEDLHPFWFTIEFILLILL